jgi:hypothetical protein
MAVASASRSNGGAAHVMSKGPLITCLLPLAVTFATLLQVKWNRSAGRDPIVLSDRELVLSTGSSDNSVTTLRISWHHGDPRKNWANREKLIALGFDCAVDPVSPAAERYYQRMLPRPIFVTFELDGPAFDAMVSEWQAQARIQAAQDARPWWENTSRLVAIDADARMATLTQRYADARRYLITAASMRVRLQRPRNGPPYIVGELQQIFPNTLHVPSSLARTLRLIGQARQKDHDARHTFHVSVRYGRRGEPWVVDVDQP